MIVTSTIMVTLKEERQPESMKPFTTILDQIHGGGISEKTSNIEFIVKRDGEKNK